MNDFLVRHGDAHANEPREITYEEIRRMFQTNRQDAEECRRVTESSKRGESYYADDGRPGNEKISDFMTAFFKETLYRDMKTCGYMMEYPHGTIIRQGERNHFYRGENQIYPESWASVYRKMKTLGTEEERQIYKMVADMRVWEFGSFLFRLGIVRFWANEYGTVLFEPLAQHYGLETEWLDITDDFNVALFFAACRWDPAEKRWLPLTRKETERSENTKYGVLFHISQERASIQLMHEFALQNEEVPYITNAILPIGFQPFMRCHSQNAYGIHMEKAYCPLQDDFNFEKLRFRHNEKLSRDIYELMDQGRAIYPQEGLDDFEDVIRMIKTAVSFSDGAFRYALEKNTYFTDAQQCEEALATSRLFGGPVRITGDQHPYRVSRQRVRRCDRKYEGFSLQKTYGVTLSARWCYRGPSSEASQEAS